MVEHPSRLTPCLLVAVMAAGTLVTGCVRRTISITSEPPGALVWLNQREIGRTPVEVDFLYYGEYDVRLVKEGSAAVMTSARADPPPWDMIPLDLAAELMPLPLHHRVVWHFELPAADNDPERLLDRARALRREIPAADPEPAPPDGAGDDPGDDL